MMWRVTGRCLVSILILVLSGSLHAQDGERPKIHSVPPAAAKSDTDQSNTRDKDEDRYTLQPGEDPENRLISPFFKHLATDQQQFWTSPIRLRMKDLKWIAPFAGVTAVSIASDSWLARQIPDNTNQLRRSRDFSN